VLDYPSSVETNKLFLLLVVHPLWLLDYPLIKLFDILHYLTYFQQPVIFYMLF
jgi:hypothetical protein